MRHLRACLVLVALSLPSVAQAHGHRWDFSMAAATATGSRLWGGRVAVGVTSNKPANKDLSFLFDLTNLKGEHNSEDVTHLSYLVGGRYAVLSNNKHLLMLHGIGGIVHKHQGATDRTDGAVTLGAAYEWVPRGAYAGWAARVQVEQSFLPSKSVKGYTQISIGAVQPVRITHGPLARRSPRTLRGHRVSRRGRDGSGLPRTRPADRTGCRDQGAAHVRGQRRKRRRRSRARRVPPAA